MKILSFLLKSWLAVLGLVVFLLFLFLAWYFIYNARQHSYTVKDGKVYYKSGNWPSYSSKEIKEADTNSFESLKYPYAKDKHFVYHEGMLIENCDPQTFEILHLKHAFSRDQNKIFWYRSLISNDPDNFEIINSSYSKDSRQVMRGAFVIKEADPQTFEYLGNAYSRDKNNVYYQYDKVLSAQPENFALDSEDKELGRDGDKLFRKGVLTDSDYRRLSDHYTVDSKFVKYNEEIIPGADPSTFSIIKNKYRPYAKDQNKVYFRNQIITDADPISFEVLEEGYGFCRDAKYGYYESKKISNSHGSSFELIKISPKMARDKNYIYDGKGNLIPGVNGSTFHLIGESYGTDNKIVLYKTSIVEGADAATFKVSRSSQSKASDKNHSYFMEKRDDV